MGTKQMFAYQYSSNYLLLCLEQHEDEYMKAFQFLAERILLSRYAVLDYVILLFLTLLLYCSHCLCVYICHVSLFVLLPFSSFNDRVYQVQ